MSSFRDLIAWQKAMDLAEKVYSVTGPFPSDERFGLISQLRRCAVSIPSNLAEGHGRLTTRDWQHFLSQARGSALELETQLLLASRLHLGKESDVHDTIQDTQEVARIINGLLSSTRSRPDRKPELS